MNVQDLRVVVNEYLRSIAAAGIVLDAQDQMVLLSGIQRFYGQYCADHDLTPLPRIDPFMILASAPYVLVNDVGVSRHFYPSILARAFDILMTNLGRTGVIVPVAAQERLWAMVDKSAQGASAYSLGELGLYASVSTASQIRPPYPWVKTAYRIGRFVFGS